VTQRHALRRQVQWEPSHQRDVTRPMGLRTSLEGIRDWTRGLPRGSACRRSRSTVFEADESRPEKTEADHENRDCCHPGCISSVISLEGGIVSPLSWMGWVVDWILVL